MHEPAEKNLKHKTDVLSWDDVRWETCDLNFRAPLEEKLTMRVGRAYSHLVIASACGIAAAIVIVQIVMPQLSTRSPLEALLVAGVVAALVAAGFYRPLPRFLGQTTNTSVTWLAAASVLTFFLGIRFSYLQKSFLAGIFLLINVALPWSLLIADQMTSHIIHWMSADPRVDRNTMVAWRNAWCGRFLTEHVDILLARGVSPSVITKLKTYRWGHVRVGVACIAGSFAALILAPLVELGRAGPAIAVITTALFGALAVATHASTPRAAHRFTQMLGHWFEYHKDTIKPPWVMTSPAGSQLTRAFVAYGAAATLSCALALLGLSGGPWDTRTIADLGDTSVIEILAAGLGAVILAPLNLLLVCFVVSAPVVSACDQGMEEVNDEDEKA